MPGAHPSTDTAQSRQQDGSLPTTHPRRIAVLTTKTPRSGKPGDRQGRPAAWPMSGTGRRNALRRGLLTFRPVSLCRPMRRGRICLTAAHAQAGRDAQARAGPGRAGECVRDSLTGMTGAPTPPPTLSPRDEVRVSFGLCAKKLGDLAHDLIPPDPAPRPETACAAPSPCASGWTPSLPRPSSPNARRAPAGPPSARPSAASPGSPCTGAGPDDWATAGRRALGGSSGLTAWDAAAALDIAYARLDDDRPRDAFSSGLDAVRFPDAEAARVRRVCAAALDPSSAHGGKVDSRLAMASESHDADVSVLMAPCLVSPEPARQRAEPTARSSRTRARTAAEATSSGVVT
jgi:hypothetical protein